MQMKWSLLALLAVIFIAGCVGQSGGKAVRLVSNDGLQIMDFFAEPISVEVGDTVVFNMQVENVGGTEAQNVVARLLGVEGQWTQVTGGFPLIQNLGNMEAPNPDFNQPGDSEQATWVYRTPEIPPGLKVPMQVTAEILYTYNTSGVITIRTVGETFLETEYQPKGKVPAGPQVINTYAPVQIKMNDRFTDYYIRVKEDARDQQIQTFPILIELQNVGSGFPITDGSPGTIYGTIRLRGPGGPVWEECLGNSGSANAEIEPNTLGAEIAQLRESRGKAVISCTISVNKDAFVLTDESIQIDFFLIYRYYIQKPLTVEVSSYP